MFYDRLQLVQSSHIPKYISEADCKLTLYRNCRNTENIAITSLKPISERTPKLYDGAIKVYRQEFILEKPQRKLWSELKH